MQRTEAIPTLHTSRKISAGWRALACAATRRPCAEGRCGGVGRAEQQWDGETACGERGGNGTRDGRTVDCGQWTVDNAGQ